VAGDHQFQALVTFTQKATCGIDAADLAWCWGINSVGEVDINFSVWESPPQSVLKNHQSQALATYYGDMTCGLTTEGDPDYSSGEILCWGADSSGEYLEPTPIDPGDGNDDRPFTALVSGLCALGNSGQAYCWGRNTFGSVGNGEASGTWGGSVYAPTAVKSPIGELPQLFRMMGGKDLHTCGIATDGFAYCWGANESGELGDGTTRDSPLPVKVAGQ
jgi:alpha-tubulin suppressor-like RCC1 family protein